MQPKPEFLNTDDFPEPHMEAGEDERGGQAPVSEAERLAHFLDAIHAGNAESLMAQMAAKSAAAELRRLADLEGAYVQQGRDLTVMCDAYDRLAAARGRLVNLNRTLRAELRRLAAEVDRAHEARRKAQAQREADCTRLMAEAKREQRERGKAERERDALAAQMLRFESVAEIPHDELADLRADRDRLAAEVEALRADAERYRWLRRDITTLADIKRMNDIVTNLCLEDMDAAIDAAKASAA